MRFTGLETHTARLDARSLDLEGKVERLNAAVTVIMTFLNTPQQSPFARPSSTKSPSSTQSISHLIT